jgi:hypothetical protein
VFHGLAHRVDQPGVLLNFPDRIVITHASRRLAMIARSAYFFIATACADRGKERRRACSASDLEVIARESARVPGGALLATKNETLIELTLDVLESLPIWLRYTVRARLGEQQRPFGREAIYPAIEAGPVRAATGTLLAHLGHACNISFTTEMDR